MKKLVLALMFVLSLLAVPAMADTSSNYEFDNIYVDGVGWEDGSIYVERGATVAVRVYLAGLDETKDVNIKAWLGGYEYDNVQATSGMFDVEAGVTYGKTLSITLPEDMISEQDYTLYVEMYDDSDSITETATLRVSKERHLVSIQDVIISNAEAGDYVSATVRLENMGDHKEEDLLVTVSVPELGIEESTYLDELTDNEVDNEDEESSGDVTVTFQLPTDAETADYEVNVKVTYNRGHSETEGSTSFNVESLTVEETNDDSGVTVVVTGDENEENSGKGDFSTALRLGFGILAVLIVILALILIVRR
jgi:hypothetical protein